MHPPKPVAVFYPAFGPVGDAFIAEFGADDPETTGGKPFRGKNNHHHRIIQIHIKRTLENLKVLDNSGNIKKDQVPAKRINKPLKTGIIVSKRR